MPCMCLIQTVNIYIAKILLIIRELIATDFYDLNSDNVSKPFQM